MAANVESMFYVESEGRPWHGLGVPLNNPATAEEAIKVAKLDWEVKKVSLYLENGLQITDAFATVRMDTSFDEITREKILGVVGDRYLPLQNKNAFAFFDAIVGEGQAIYHTAGVLGKGERIWLLAKLPGEIRVINDDIAEKYLLLTNSHDGKYAVQVKFTCVRVVCSNTLASALHDGGDIINIRHTTNMDEKLKVAHKLLGITNIYYQQLNEVFTAMARFPLDSRKLDGYINTVLPAGKEETRNNIIKLFENGRGTDMPEIRGTLWAGLNAFTEYVDWHRPRVKPENKLNSIWFGSGAQIKQRAFNEAIEILKAA